VREKEKKGGERDSRLHATSGGEETGAICSTSLSARKKGGGEGKRWVPAANALLKSLQKEKKKNVLAGLVPEREKEEGGGGE